MVRSNTGKNNKLIIFWTGAIDNDVWGNNENFHCRGATLVRHKTNHKKIISCPNWPGRRHAAAGLAKWRHRVCHCQPLLDAGGYLLPHAMRHSVLTAHSVLRITKEWIKMQMYANSQYNRSEIRIKIHLKNMTLKASFVDLRTNQHGCGQTKTQTWLKLTGETSGRYDGYHDQSGGVNYSLSCMKWVIKD